ncbi:DUF2334 domain-containing protein [Methanotorris formicicus]|uniref:Polysaccharide deacetylase n=1 Tax=Methanotorris formicicus Mc-S-70 TaxID=647171 RepID=H1KWR2_9EURY|nr:DUF2334 domain-containing protein [Methanotorris formicicus]EHP89177.1 polysaccharide deacetylase [Methanotorris formicicus Mc-S-70]
MKKFIFLISIALILVILQGNYLNKTSKEPKITKNLYKKPIILVHDVSPKYFADLKEVVKVIDKHNYSNNTILFVIPELENPPSGGKWDLRKNKDFVEYLHQLEKRGYKIELHGYKHTFHEFNCSKDMCLEKLHNAELIMKECGFNNTTLFLPPAWALNNESLKVLLAHNYTIILTNKIIYPNGSSKKIINKEYTWYLKKEYVDMYLIIAEVDYHTASEYNVPFYVSIHLGVVNYGGGLEFLDRFLNETERWS